MVEVSILGEEGYGEYFNRLKDKTNILNINDDNSTLKLQMRDSMEKIKKYSNITDNL